MATTDIRKAHTLRLLAVDALAIGVTAMAFSAGIASANPNDPGMTDVRGDGVVHSRQSAGVTGTKHCAVDPGTLNTSSTNSSGMGVPTQHAHEAGPAGSDQMAGKPLVSRGPTHGADTSTHRTLRPVHSAERVTPARQEISDRTFGNCVRSPWNTSAQ